jgi:hypothetical protein
MLSQASTSADFIVDASTITIFLGFVVPFLVGLLTKLNASPKIQAITLLVINAIVAYVTTSQVADGGAVFSKESFIAFALGLFASISSYFGVWKPTNAAQTVQVLTAPFGIGGSVAGARAQIEELKLLKKVA